MSTEHHRRLERLYLSAPVNRVHEPTIDVRRGEAVIGTEARPGDLHGGGAVHGAFLFKLLDDASFFAANSLVADALLVTASFHVHFLRPVAGGRLRAQGRVVSRSRRLVVAEAVVRDEREREVARGSGTFMPGSVALGDLPGYREAGGQGIQP